MNKTNIFLWTLYDFANSVVVVVFFFYFSQWLVIEQGIPDLGYNAIYAVGSVLLLLTAPVLGAIADKTGRQSAYLIRVTFAMAVAFLGTSLAALFVANHPLLAALFFLLSNYFYQLSFVFYNSLLPDIAPPERWGRVSGIGQAGNWLGQIAGLGLALPFAAGAFYVFGEAGRAQTFLPAVLAFIVLALPFLLFFKPARPVAQGTPSIGHELRQQWAQFKRLVRAPGMALFFISYFFFMDALITVANNFPIYLQNVFNVPDRLKTLLLVGLLVMAAIGALLSGVIADRIGLKRTLAIVLGSWIVILPLLGFATDVTSFSILTVLAGVSFGSIWAVTRAVMTALCPKDQLSFGFGFYTLTERAAAFLGPLSWGAITWFLESLGATRYRVAMVAMAAYVAIGLVLFLKVAVPPGAVQRRRGS